jgi:hypothetical protein
MVYTTPPELATMTASMTVTCARTSGEAEFYIIPAPDGLLIGAGSDHTDREQEAIDVAASKLLCAKVLSPDLWRYDDVRDHWDRLEIRSWMTDTTGRRLYQEGRLESFLTVADVLAEVERQGHRLAGRIVFGGTLPAIGGLSYGRRFEVELSDPVLGRSLGCAYDVVLRPD